MDRLLLGDVLSLRIRSAATCIDLMQKLVFASEQMPDALDDRARFSLFRDVLASTARASDLSCFLDRPFVARLEVMSVGDARILQCQGTLSRMSRTAQTVVADANDDFVLALNCGRSRLWHSQLNREAVLNPGTALFMTNGAAAELRSDGENCWRALVVPRRLLREAVVNVEDLLAAPLPDGAALRHLERYLGMLLEPGGFDDDPPLIAQIDRTLVDLFSLALGAHRDAAELARTRGLRAARIQQIVALIKANFSNPRFSLQQLSLRLALSPRYIQELLQETGTSFTERVLELRLQKAHAMLADRRHDRLRIAEIAQLCGFNEIPYFNRTFRRRFGASPTQCRGPNGNGVLSTR